MIKSGEGFVSLFFGGGVIYLKEIKGSKNSKVKDIIWILRFLSICTLPIFWSLMFSSYTLDE